MARELLSNELRPPLLDAEREILTHVLDGLTDTEIAERMGISPERAAPDIIRVVTRILSPQPGEDRTQESATPGKHRRPDGEQRS